MLPIMRLPVPPPSTAILSARLRARDIDALADFYRSTLGLTVRPGSDGSNSIVVDAGASRLEFVDSTGTGPRPVHHLAFGIPEHMVPEALEWARRRMTILRDARGDEIVHFTGWNAHAFYFMDPEGNILEFIGRHDSPDAAAGPFHPGLIRSLSEVAIAVPDQPGVAAFASALRDNLGLDPYRSGSDDFAAVGDERGLLVLLREGRPWFMAEHVPATVEATEVTLSGPRRGTVQLPGVPISVRCDG
jgi:catechol 2,3-dioxygenase-like lactoylglutathione lyase family enzyme